MNGKTLGEKIRQLRIANNMSQKELADKLGYQSDTAIYLIEKNERNITIDKLKSVANLFSISVEDLIGEENVESKQKVDISTALRAQELDSQDIDHINAFIEFIKKRSEDKKQSS